MLALVAGTASSLATNALVLDDFPVSEFAEPRPKYEVAACTGHSTAVLFTQEFHNEDALSAHNHSKRVPGPREDPTPFWTALRRFTVDTDVYVCTDRADAEFAADRLHNVQGVDSGEDHLATFVAKRGSNAIQWWRLKHCWDVVKAREHACGKTYIRAARLRTDIRLDTTSSLETLLNSTHLFSPRTVAMHSDWMFAGPRGAMELLAGLYDRIPEFVRKGPWHYYPLGFDAVMASDMRAGKTHWVAFPKSVVGHCDMCTDLKQTIQAHRAKFLAAGNGTAAYETCSLFNAPRKSPINQGWSSERMIVVVLWQGSIAVRPFPAPAQKHRLWGSSESFKPDIPGYAAMGCAAAVRQHALQREWEQELQPQEEDGQVQPAEQQDQWWEVGGPARRRRRRRAARKDKRKDMFESRAEA